MVELVNGFIYSELCSSFYCKSFSELGKLFTTKTYFKKPQTIILPALIYPILCQTIYNNYATLTHSKCRGRLIYQSIRLHGEVLS